MKFNPFEENFVNFYLYNRQPSQNDDRFNKQNLKIKEIFNQNVKFLRRKQSTYSMELHCRTSLKIDKTSQIGKFPVTRTLKSFKN